MENFRYLSILSSVLVVVQLIMEILVLQSIIHIYFIVSFLLLDFFYKKINENKSTR
jgi:hypothetical protein